MFATRHLCVLIAAVFSGTAGNLQRFGRFHFVDSVQRDEAERIGGESSEASDNDGAMKDSVSRVAEKASAAPIGAAEEVPLPKAEHKAPPVQVRVCMFVCPPFCLLESSSRRHFVRIDVAVRYPRDGQHAFIGRLTLVHVSH